MRPGVVVDHLGERLAVLVHTCPSAYLIVVCRVTTLASSACRSAADVAESHAVARLVLVRSIVEDSRGQARCPGDGTMIGLPFAGMQDVVGRHHEHARFELRLQRQRHVHRHLVAVEVGVECRADQRMQLDRLALDQHRLEAPGCRGGAGSARGSAAPDARGSPLRGCPTPPAAPSRPCAWPALMVVGHAVELELRVDERLEQLERHLLRQAALMQLELRTDHDHRAARNSRRACRAGSGGTGPACPSSMSASDFSGRLLAPVMTRPRRPLSNSASTASCSMRFFVAHDDVGRAQLDQPLQAVVAVDDAAIEIVEVGGREASAVERHQRAQLGRDHRHDRRGSSIPAGCRIR